MTTRVLTTLPAALAAILVLGACGSGDATTRSTTTTSVAPSTTAVPSTNAASPASRPAAPTSAGIAMGDHADAMRSRDIMFAQMMIPHHEQAIVLADMALTGHDASAKVQDLAKRIKGAQAPEITQMKSWLTAWGAPESMGHDMPMQGIVSDAAMKTLAASHGAAFDKLWLTDMIGHHEGAIAMARDVQSSQDPQVVALAKSIIDGQAKEIAEMKALLG